MRAVAHSRAMALGMTSPKMSMSGVSMAVATSQAAFGRTGISAQVARLAAMTWARVTPIKAVDRTRSGRRNDSR